MTPLKNILLLLPFSLLILSCEADSPDKEPEKPEEKLEVNLSVPSHQLGVDEMAVIEFSSNKPLVEVRDVWETGHRSYSMTMPGESLPDDLKLYFKYPDPGAKKVHLEFTSLDGITVAKELNFEVSRGNTVQIIGIEVHSFRNMDGTWDPEYGEDDEDRLADVGFVLEKLRHSNFVSEEHFMGRWYQSDVRKNQQDLYWDLSEEELYVDSRHLVQIGLADEDNGQLAEDLFPMPVLLDFRLMQYEESRPEQVNLISEELEVNLTFYLDWP